VPGSIYYHSPLSPPTFTCQISKANYIFHHKAGHKSINLLEMTQVWAFLNGHSIKELAYSIEREQVVIKINFFLLLLEFAPPSPPPRPVLANVGNNVSRGRWGSRYSGVSWSGDGGGGGVSYKNSDLFPVLVSWSTTSGLGFTSCTQTRLQSRILYFDSVSCELMSVERLDW